MDCHPPLRMKATLLIVFLLKSTNIIRLHGSPLAGADYNLHCVNDYLTTVYCSLNITPSENTSNSNSSYWLIFTDSEETYECMLTHTKENYFCTFNTSETEPDDGNTFTDLDEYKISLCHDPNESETCDVLDEQYLPVGNIKPNAPCCLSVSTNSSHHHFAWKSTYETCTSFTGLPDNLEYQLHYYKRGEHKVTFRKISTQSTSISFEDQNFEPDTDYGARVRSIPNAGMYQGEWSHWSDEAHWRTNPAVDGFSTRTFISEMCKKVLIPICGLVVFVILICYAPVKKWKQNVFIPTPAPYFHTLYSDCQGDFKSWVVTQENTADMLEKEETLQIDTLTKCAEVQEDDCPPHFDQHVMEGSSYSNITPSVCDTTLLGVPYAVSTMIPLSAQGSPTNSLVLDSQLGSPSGDSGCWLCSDTSLERDPPWYCNEYCTLSAFQQSSSVLTEHHGSL